MLFIDLVKKNVGFEPSRVPVVKGNRFDRTSEHFASSECLFVCSCFTSIFSALLLHLLCLVHQLGSFSFSGFFKVIPAVHLLPGVRDWENYASSCFGPKLPDAVFVIACESNYRLIMRVANSRL